MDVERLSEEVYTIQIIDGYLKDGQIRSDEEFLRDGVDITEFMDENMLEEYMDIDDDEYEGYTDTIEDVMEILVSDLEIYSDLYKIPKLSIANEEWDLFFDTIYEYYENNNLSEFYFSDMVDLNRFAIAKSLVYDQESIDLNTYVGALKYMESDVLYISDIKVILTILEDKFDRKNLFSLIANSDGSFGNYGKNYDLDENISLNSHYFELITNSINQENIDALSNATSNSVIDFKKALQKKKK